MLYSDCNLQQLLDLALRVPEIGAVNFNILYFILKTIIEKEGLQDEKPSINLKIPSFTKVSFRRSHSAESLKLLDVKEKKQEEKDHSETFEWDKVQVLKRMDAVEEQIGLIQDEICQQADQLSDFDRIFQDQENKFLNKLTDFYQSIESKLEASEKTILSEKLEDVISKVSDLMTMREEMNELREMYEEIVSGNEESLETEEIKPQETVFKSHESMLSEKQYKKDLTETKLEKPKLDETLPSVEESGKNKTSEVHTKEELKLQAPDFTTAPEKPDESIEKEVKKTSHRKTREQEILSKIEALNEEITSIKEHLKSETLKTLPIPAEKNIHESEKKQKTIHEKVKEKRIDDYEEEENEKDILKKFDVIKIDLQLLTISQELKKVVDDYNALERMFSVDIDKLKENTSILEYHSNKYAGELEDIKANLNELVLSFENTKENLTFIESQVDMLTELPGIKNRIEQLEEYVYSGTERSVEDTFKKAEKIESEPDFRHTTESVADSESDEDYEYSRGLQFKTVIESVRVAQDMTRKRHPSRIEKGLPKLSEEDIQHYGEQQEEDEEKHEVPRDFPAFEKIPSDKEVPQKEPEEIIKSTAFTSSDLLEETSRQLRGQVVVYVKKRLHDFEIEFQVIKGNVTTMEKKIGGLEKHVKDLGEKITFMDANFSQRAGDLAALKSMAESHQVSIISIMYHLDRKAEAYAVNHKVSRRELTVIEDRVLKLCRESSSEITKLEQKIDDTFQNFNYGLDNKLSIQEFEIRVDFLLHKLKTLEMKLKEISSKPPIISFEGIRSGSGAPVEIKKYVLSKDGTKIIQDRKPATIGKTKSSPVSFLPLIDHHADREASPKTAMQVQRGLELASSRESKRYVGGAYTKIKAGRK